MMQEAKYERHVVVPEGGCADISEDCMSYAAELVHRACTPDISRPDEVLLLLSLVLGILESALTVKDAAHRQWPGQLRVCMLPPVVLISHCHREGASQIVYDALMIGKQLGKYLPRRI